MDIANSGLDHSDDDPTNSHHERLERSEALDGCDCCGFAARFEALPALAPRS